MAHELEVWLFADRVGTLALVDGRLSFCYAPSWLAHKDAIALSASLPLQTEPLDDRKTRSFFAGLLPEGQMRRLIAQQFQVSDQNDFALLDHIGGECAGAVTFLEPGPSWMNCRVDLCSQAKTACGFLWLVLKTNCRWCLMARASGCPSIARRAPTS